MQNRTLEEKGFSTQYDLIKRFGKNNTRGLCGAFSNLYAKQHISGSTNDSFLSKSKSEIYALAINEDKHQQELKASFGANSSLYSAFHDFKIPYSIYEKNTHEISADLIHRITDHSPYVFINYPTPTESSSLNRNHQIYFGKLSKNKCTYFNANRLYGEYIDKCEKVAHEVAKDIEENASFDGRPSYISLARN